MENKSIKAPFLPLIWRAYQLCSKTLCINVIFAVVLSAIGIMFPLSFKYGNLKVLFEEIPVDKLWQNMHYGIVALVCYSFGGILFAVSESVIADTKKKWVFFLKSTPVTPCRLALAKYAFKFFIIIAQLIISFIYSALICSLCDKSFDIKVAAIVVALAAFMLMFATLMEIFAHLTSSTDKAGLCTMGVMFAAVFALKPLFDGRTFGEIIKMLASNCDTIVAAAVFVMLFMFIIGFICSIFLYRRYEK